MATCLPADVLGGGSQPYLQDILLGPPAPKAPKHKLAPQPTVSQERHSCFELRLNLNSSSRIPALLEALGIQLQLPIILGFSALSLPWSGGCRACAEDGEGDARDASARRAGLQGEPEH